MKNQQITFVPARHRTVCVVLVLLALFVLVLADLKRPVDWTPLRSQGPIVVKVTGNDFHWRFCLSGRDGIFETRDDVRVENELHLPVNREVRLLLTSDDYVYTVNISEMNVRHIAVPELIYTLDLTPAETGSFNILSDPLCGVRLWHEDYMGRIVVESKSDFQSWYTSIR